MIDVSHADRIVFPDIGTTKGDVVAYYERIATRALAHVEGRPLSIKRFPRGLAAAGFFQKNVPAHYPASIERFAVPRSHEASRRHRNKDAQQRDVTLYPVLRDPTALPYVANQGAIELHVTLARVPDVERPDRFVIDLDPPPGALPLVRQAALAMRDLLGEFGLQTAPMATGSKGYHLIAALIPSVDVQALALAGQKVAALAAARHPTMLTSAFRINARGQRVFVDWLRNNHSASVIAPLSLRARPTAPVAVPLAWAEVPDVAPDAFTIKDVDTLVDRDDPVAALQSQPCDPARFVAAVDAAFDASGLVLEPFDRFRS